MNYLHYTIQKLTFYNTFTYEKIKTIDLKKYECKIKQKAYYSQDGESLIALCHGDHYYLNNDNKLSLVNKFSIQGTKFTKLNHFILSFHANSLFCYNLNMLDLPDKMNNSNIYPNPTSNIINIDIETPTTLELFDIFGNKLLEDFNTKLDISNLTPGTYYIRYLGQTKMVAKI